MTLLLSNPTSPTKPVPRRSMVEGSGAANGTALTMTLPRCELVNPLRLLTSLYLVLLTHFTLRLPGNLLSLAQQIMSLTLKIHRLGL